MDDFLIYLGTFAVSFIFFFLGDNLKKNGKNSHIVKNIMYAIACLLPCFLAAFRDVTVGGDVKVYVLPEFNRAKNTGWIDFYFGFIYNEPLFSLLIYICSNYFTIEILFFIIQLLVIIPVFFAVRSHTDKVCIIMTIFNLLFYNMSLGVMRQCISMGLFLLAYCIYEKKKYFFSGIIWSLSALFHVSAIIILVLVFLCKYVMSHRYMLRSFLILGFLILFFVFSNTIIWHVYPYVGLLSGRYMYYIETLTLISKNYSQIPVTDLLCKSLIVIICGFMISIYKKWDKNIYYTFFMTIIGRYFIIFCANFLEALRLAFYFDYFIFLLIPEVLSIRMRRSNKIIISISMLFIATLYWIYFIYGKRAYETVPFLFS